MPMFEYKCQGCSEEFEELAGVDELPPCPKCGSAKVEKQISACAVQTDGSSGGGMPDLGSMPPMGGMGGGCGGGG